MLFGVRALGDRTRADSGVDAVMSRVHAYLEVKQQIRQNPSYRPSLAFTSAMLGLVSADPSANFTVGTV